jgi:NAD(P)-dependent dehydrogenase (short-subunit alcohol dehydrogenase family)
MGVGLLPELLAIRFSIWRFAMGIGNNFQGKIAIVTGSSLGIGRATAICLAGRGASVAVVARNFERVKVVQEEIRNSGGQAVAVEADVAKEGDVTAMVNKTLKAFGAIDFLVNNAGVGPQAIFSELEPAEWDRVLSVNLRGPYLCCREVFPHMKARGKGAIVNVSSLAGRSSSHFGGAHYTASKAGLLGLTRHIAREMAPYRIRVNAVCPGPVMTPMFEENPGRKMAKEIASKIALGYISQPEEQARVIAFLLSDESSYITGATIDSNGGLLMV